MVNPLTKVRSVAALIALAALVTLITRTGMTMSEKQVSWLGALWVDFRFFTIWTNTLVGMVCACLAFGRNIPQWLTAGSALSIALVAGVYHALLAAGRELVGLDLVVDAMFHTILPAAFISFWVFGLAKDQLRWEHLVIWSAYPTLYSVYAITPGWSTAPILISS